MTRLMPGSSTSDGVIIEASIVARLLGLKLLRLHADVTLIPARLEPTATVEQRGLPHATSMARPLAQPTVREVRPEAGTLSDAVMLLQRASRTLRDAKRA